MKSDNEQLEIGATTAATAKRPTSTRRSGSITPAVASAARLPSRPSSPSRLRSLPSVGLSNYEALSDSVQRGSSNNDAGAASHASDIDNSIDGSDRQYHLNEEMEDNGRSKEVVLPPQRQPLSSKYAEESLIQAGISDYTFIPPDQGGLLGRGKFSSVQLAWKHGVKYAVKITPLYPHHNLIATRLLREPTILAQLPLHPNLVKVYESIRTPGHFYLVEEYLDGYTNLENFVSSQPDSKLTLSQTIHIYHQLVSVVRSALHEPIQIAHRDIKPENILIHPITLRIILLDFGLATHFSAREAKLTTCCGSPAFHSPELVKSLKSTPGGVGNVRYWGPEIDIWTIGVTLLRCLIGIKYPLGVQHTSLQHLADKTIDAILSVKDYEFRTILAGLLDMDGEKRWRFFRELPMEIDSIPYKTLHPEEHHDYLVAKAAQANAAAAAATSSSGNNANTAANATGSNSSNRHFKNTTFIETEPKHSLSLILAPSPNASATNSGFQATTHQFHGTSNGNHAHHNASFFLRSRSQSRDGLWSSNHPTPTLTPAPGLELNDVNERLSALHPTGSTSTSGALLSSVDERQATSSISSHSATTPELLLLNPQAEPAMRAISYVKYALRCAGILYHCQAPSDDLSKDLPSVTAPKEKSGYPILHCVRVMPKGYNHNSSGLAGRGNSPAASLLNQLRPPISRAQTMGVTRSSSTPPVARNGNRAASKGGQKDEDGLKCLEFWLQIVPVYAVDRPNTTTTSTAGTSNSAITATAATTSQKPKRPKSRSRGLSSALITTSEDTRKCTKLRIRISDESVRDVIKKALQGGTSSEIANDYALFATPPPPRHMALPSVTSTTSSGLPLRTKTRSQESTTTGESEEGEGRGRSKLSRSRSSEKISPPGSNSRKAAVVAAPPSSGTATGLSPQAGKLDLAMTKPSDEGAPGREAEGEDGAIKHEVREVRSESDEENIKPASRSTYNNSTYQATNGPSTKRGFFDFVNFNLGGGGRNASANMRASGMMTAPTTPAAIQEEELEPDYLEPGPGRGETMVTRTALAVAPM